MASTKIAKYNPQKDIVAGRTASQIERAKKMAVGGKKKRCVKGKSCSATCIAASKVCMVDIPWAAAKGIPKVVAAIKKVQENKKPSVDKEEMKKIAQEMYKSEWVKAWKNMNLAISDGDNQKYNFWKEQISKYHAKLTSKGVDVGPLKIPTWQDKTPPVSVMKEDRTKNTTKPSTGNAGDKKVDSQGRPLSYTPLKELPGFVNATGVKPTLPPLKTSENFLSIRADSSYSSAQNHPYRKLDEAHDRLGAILRISGDLTPEQQAIAKKLGGESAFREAVSTARGFTGSSYDTMREAQRLNSEGKQLTGYLQYRLREAEATERLVALLPKEPLVKYRGIKASDERLNAIIAASKDKGDHAEGALASWSTSLQTAQNFADKGSTSNRVIFRTINKKGASVRTISHYDTEDEILTPGSARYKHTGEYEVITVGTATYHVFNVIEN